MIFINTRPSPRAQPLSDYILHHNIKVYELPLLEIVPLDINTTEIQYLTHMAQGGYDAQVCISPSAVELGLNYYYKHYKASFDPQCPIIAVGAATAQVFKDFFNTQTDDTQTDIQKLQIICPSIANNEGMLAMPELARLKKDQRILVWRGQGGRRLLVNHLQNKGVIVDSIEWYKRQRPKNALAHLTQLYQQIALLTSVIDDNSNNNTSNITLDNTANNNSKSRLDGMPNNQPTQQVCVLISSGESFAHWRNLLQEFAERYPNIAQPPKLTSFCYLVLGERLETILSQASTMTHHLSYQRISSLDPNCIMSGLTKLSEHTP